jgi:predicted nucleotidyltransferase component of viral defense system
LRKGPAHPPELLDWQVDVLARVARARLAKELVFAGGAALSAVHLHHRLSEDLDFFARRELGETDLAGIARSLRGGGIESNLRTLGAVQSLVLSKDGQAVGKVDFVYSPFDPIHRRTRWRGLDVDSLLDMTVGKVHAVLSRFQPRDFVDLYLLLREGPERDPRKLLGLVRAKFDVGADPFTLGERLLLARDIRILPRMLRPLDLPELVAFLEAVARDLVR